MLFQFNIGSITGPSAVAPDADSTEFSDIRSWQESKTKRRATTSPIVINHRGLPHPALPPTVPQEIDLASSNLNPFLELRLKR